MATAQLRVKSPLVGPPPFQLRRAFQALAICFALIPFAALQAADPAPLTWTLLPTAEVDGLGVFFYQVFAKTDQPPPHIRLADAPPPTRATVLTRTQLTAALHAASPQLNVRFAGAEQIRIVRRTKLLAEAEMKDLLTVALQESFIHTKGELELRFARTWHPLIVPDDPFTIKILDLPTAGVSPNFLLRFELRTARESFGPHQASLQARIWKDLWIARSPLNRGDSISQADLVRERRDLLAVREPCLDSPQLDPAIELSQAIPAGMPVFLRSIRLRPVVHKGQIVDAHVLQGPVLISLKVEVLQEGAPGDLVRVRNTQSRREFRGKVQDEQTILVSL